MIESDPMRYNYYMETKLLSPLWTGARLCKYGVCCCTAGNKAGIIDLSSAHTHLIVPQRIECVQSNYLIK